MQTGENSIIAIRIT